MVEVKLPCGRIEILDPDNFPSGISVDELEHGIRDTLCGPVGHCEYAVSCGAGRDWFMRAHQ